MADKKPASVTKKKVKGTTYVVSSFFNEAAKETLFDKLQRVAERDVAVSVPVTKNKRIKVLKCFTRRTRCGIMKSMKPVSL